MLIKTFIEKMTFLIKKFYILLIITLYSFCLIQYGHSLENRIIYKINNEIITSFDLKKELRYLSLINPRILNLEKNEIFEISKKSIIREKIKKIEILNHITEIKLEENYTNQLIKNTYSKIGFKNINEFKEKIKSLNISFEEFVEKITIEALWNQMIYEKYKTKIKINKTKLEIEISSKENQSEFQLSEIVFNVDKKENLQKKINLIKTDIKNKGFENAALIHSISQSKNSGGVLGWINENSINNNLKNVIHTLKIGQYSDPQIIPGGFLILKLNDIKNKKISVNMKKELNNLIKIKTNQQLNQFSNIYFNKIKKNISIEKI
tara:strand:- start:652 stop:1617 length:966 start_codon:yes stop_codon:yes gene_type:complete